MKIDIKEYVLTNPPDILSDVEIHVLQQTLSSPTVKRYLNTLMWNSLRDLGSLSMADLSTDMYKLQHAYVKGGIGMLVTLLSIDATLPPPSK